MKRKQIGNILHILAWIVLILFFVLALSSCGTPKKAVQARSDRYHNFNGFHTGRTHSIWAGW